MLRVETHRRLSDIRSIDATRVVVYDQFDNPICVVIELGGGITIAETAASPQFNEVLRQLGISCTTVIRELEQTPLPQIHM